MFKVEVLADNSGVYVSNGLEFDHVAKAEEYGIDLMSRWTLVRSWRVVEIKTGKVIRQY